MTDDSPPVVERALFRSRDVAEVEHHLGRTYTGMSIAVPGDPAGFSCHHDVITSAGIGISRLTMPVSWTADLDPMPDQIVVEHVHSGGLAWRSREYGDVATAAGGTVLVPPSGEFGAVCDFLDIDIVGLDALRVADYAAHVSGVDPDTLTISAVRPLSGPLANQWRRTVAAVRNDVLGDPFAARSPILVDSAFRSLAATLLSAFPNTALAHVTDPEAPPPRGTVPESTLREVVDYLRTHADRPIGPRDIAELAGMPAREIVAGLRRRHDVHPAQLLWSARLVGLYKDLRDRDRNAHTDVHAAVAEIATRWGFRPTTGFRLAFARAFDGVTPEQVLGRLF